MNIHKPTGEWKLWVYWLAIPSSIFIMAMFMAEFRDVAGAQWVGIALIAATLVKCPWKQRLDLTLDGEPVWIQFHMGMTRSIWITWGTDKTLGKARLTDYHAAPFWIEHELTLKDKKYNLLIYARWLRQGFLVSNNRRHFDMVINRNEFCF